MSLLIWNGSMPELLEVFVIEGEGVSTREPQSALSGTEGGGNQLCCHCSHTMWIPEMLGWTSPFSSDHWAIYNVKQGHYSVNQVD